MVETSERLAVVRVLCKKRYSENFRKIHKKTPVLESLFNLRLQRLQRRCFPVNFAKF